MQYIQIGILKCLFINIKKLYAYDSTYAQLFCIYNQNSDRSSHECTRER